MKQPPRPPAAAASVLAPSNLPYRLRLLVQSMTRCFQDLIERYDVTPLHWGVLSCLWRADGQPTQAIAQALEQLGGTLTVGIDVMEKRGLVRRRRDPRDGRISRVWLTAKGRRLQAALVPEVEAFVERMFACFSASESAAFSEMVDRLRTHVENMGPPGTAGLTPARKRKPSPKSQTAVTIGI